MKISRTAAATVTALATAAVLAGCGRTGTADDAKMTPTPAMSEDTMMHDDTMTPTPAMSADSMMHDDTMTPTPAMTDDSMMGDDSMMEDN